MDPIEKKVAATILEKGDKVQVGGKTYVVAPPTTATLILVSELVAQIPPINKAERPGEILNESLRIAKDCRVLGEIPAVIILGAMGLEEAKNITEEQEIVDSSLCGLIKKKKKVTVEKNIIIDRKKELTDILLYHTSPRELSELTANLLMSLEIGDFFGFTTSLAEINLLKPTKREVETTASGQ